MDSLSSSCTSFLGGSPRHPLPSTSADHANLLLPFKALDLSDDDSGSQSLEGMENLVLEAGTKTPQQREHQEQQEQQQKQQQEQQQQQAQQQDHQHQQPKRKTPTPSTPTRKGGKIVASRYMAEAASTTKGRRSVERGAKAGDVSLNKTTVGIRGTKTTKATGVTPSSKPATPTTPQRRRVASARAKTPTRAPLEIGSKSATAGTPGSRGTATTDNGDTPKSSLRQSDEMSDYDRYLLNAIRARQRRMIQVQLGKMKEEYLKTAISTVTSSCLAVAQLTISHCDLSSKSFETECKSKASQLDSLLRPILLELANKIVPAKDKLGSLQSALVAKSEEVEIAGSLSFPLTDDQSGQAKVMKKMVESLKSRARDLDKFGANFPPSVQKTTTQLSLLLSQLSDSVSQSSDQLTVSMKNLNRSFDILLDFLFKARFMRQEE